MGVLELAELLEAQGASGDIQFLDVREPHEHETASLPHFALMPLSRSTPRARSTLQYLLFSFRRTRSTYCCSFQCAHSFIFSHVDTAALHMLQEQYAHMQVLHLHGGQMCLHSHVGPATSDVLKM